MNKSPLLFVALILSALGCALAGAALFGSSSTPASVAAGPDPSAAQVRELTKQVDDLRAELARVASTRLESPERSTPALSTEKNPGSDAELVQRIAELEGAVTALREQAKERTARVEATQPARVDPRTTQVRAMDLRASEEERLAALKALRGQKDLAGADARSQEVVLAMLEIAERSPNEKARNDVYRDLHGVKNPALRDAMLRSLANDPSALVRRRAAEDIDTFLPDATVESALRNAADTDPDPNVRKQALETLAGGR